jgi:pimeloyl-ACP methyl ester carboxylesterase
MPATRDMTKQLAVLIYMHGTGFSRDRDGMLSLLKSLNTGFPDISAGVFGDIKATHQLAIITVSGPGEEGSNGPDWSTARARLFPDIRQSWDYLFAYIAMRTVTYAKEELAPNRIGMFGASAGGLATLLANGVDDRLDMAMPLSATGYLLESARQTNSWLGELAEAPPAFTMATERFLDPRSYLATQHAPVKLINGAQDEYYPFTSTKLTYDHIKNGLDKNLFVVPNFDHGPLVDQADLTALGYSQAAWINRYLLGHPLVTAGAPLGTPNLSVNGGLVTVTVNVPAQTLNLVLKNVLNGQSVHDVKLWASADNGYTFQSFNMSSTGGSNYQWSGTPSGVWANPSGVAWFVASEDKVTSNIMNFTADYRSTVPMYPAGFTQVLREKP